jgi:hypothetical protein
MKYRTAMRKQKASLGVVVLGIGGTLVGCNTETSRFEKITSAFGSGIITLPAPVVGGGGNTGGGGETMLPPVAPVAPAGPVVCDPFSQGSSTSSGTQGLRSGLKAALYASNSPLSGVNNYVNNEDLRVAANIYLNEINTPTRAFSDGFPVQGGGLLTNAQNQTLIEYFGLRIEGSIRLTDGQSAGFKQFGLLSDDGATLEIKNPVTGVWTMIVNNDGDHGTKLGCANNAYYMEHGVNYEIRVKYYQGPRFHIANMLVWRNVADNSASSLNYSNCGYSNNSAWFDSTQVPSVAGSKWIHAQGAGWRVVGAENFSLPATETTTNPCL